MKRKVINESKQQKFKRIAGDRTRKILRMIRILGNCSNRSVYSYNIDEVNKIFNSIEKETKRVKTLFKESVENEFSLE